MEAVFQETKVRCQRIIEELTEHPKKMTAKENLLQNS